MVTTTRVVIVNRASSVKQLRKTIRSNSIRTMIDSQKPNKVRVTKERRLM